MKKHLLLLVMIMLPLVAMADAVEINGIWYNLIDKGLAAEVTHNPNTKIKYTGSIEIPASVMYDGNSYKVISIGSLAFLDCTGLTSVTIPNSVTSIGESAFQRCSGLTSVTIPNSVTSIGNSAFYGCIGLIFVNIPNSVTSIGEYAFLECIGLTSVIIPNSVTSIGSFTFGTCIKLTSVIIPNSVTRIGSYAFSSCTGLISVNIPNSVTNIDKYAFRDCTELTSVIIPNSVTTIGPYAFYNCTNVTSVTIGSGIKSILINAFTRCPKLKDVYCLAETVPLTDSDAFVDSYIEYATLYVPGVSINAYKTTSPWSGFGTIMASDGGTSPKCATPTISYGGKKLTFSCETEGVEYVSEIKDADVKKFYDGQITLTATYEISVYATKAGYEDSDIATATLTWISGTFTETTGTGVSAPQMAYDVPVLISSQGGDITVKSEAEGQTVAVYGINGQQLGSSAISNGTATVSTALQPGSIAIVKVGQKSVKVAIK